MEISQEAKEICSGVFWIITDSRDINEYKLLIFDIPCDLSGNPTGANKIPFNAKSGNTYNHKRLWEDEIKNNSALRPYNKRTYDYYPRGRVEISNNRAVIYLNPHINQPGIIDEIRSKFGLSSHNIPEVRVVVDGSLHYRCWIDWAD